MTESPPVTPDWVTANDKAQIITGVTSGIEVPLKPHHAEVGWKPTFQLQTGKTDPLETVIGIAIWASQPGNFKIRGWFWLEISLHLFFHQMCFCYRWNSSQDLALRWGWALPSCLPGESQAFCGVATRRKICCLHECLRVFTGVPLASPRWLALDSKSLKLQDNCFMTGEEI